MHKHMCPNVRVYERGSLRSRRGCVEGSELDWQHAAETGDFGGVKCAFSSGTWM